MKQILYINACVRPESRTNRLAQAVLRREGGHVVEIKLGEAGLMPLDGPQLARRMQLQAEGKLEDASFAAARQFAAADELVIGAPTWDLSFPALLKAYFERINVGGIGFRYREDGSIESLCRAQKLIYVTTAGGPVFEPHLGFGYVRALGEAFYGIAEFEYIKAEGLDIRGADAEAILAKAMRETGAV